MTLPAPRTTDIQELVAIIAHRVKWLLRCRGLLEEWVELSDEEHPFLQASALGRVFVARLGAPPAPERRQSKKAPGTDERSLRGCSLGRT